MDRPGMAGESAVAMDVELPSDTALMEEVSRRLHEACERTTYHRVEAERWERIARACAASVQQLEAHSPVQELAPGMLMEGPQRAMPPL